MTLKKAKPTGFTLSELLIALAILGVIATFTIPKVLQSQQSNAWNASAKETIAMVSGAMQAYVQQNGQSANTGIKDLTPYMNYVSIDTVTDFDKIYSSAGNETCSEVGKQCLRLHNGALIYYDSDDIFNGTYATNALFFRFDPDSKVTEAGGPAFGSGKNLTIWMYYGGRITTYGYCDAGTQSRDWSTPTCPGGANRDPNWFNWS